MRPLLSTTGETVKRVCQRDGISERTQAGAAGSQRGGLRPAARDCRWSLEAVKDQTRSSPGEPEGR